MKRNELNDILSDLSDEPGYHARGVEEQSGPANDNIEDDDSAMESAGGMPNSDDSGCVAEDDEGVQGEYSEFRSESAGPRESISLPEKKADSENRLPGLPGKMQWNTVEPYTLEVDGLKLQNDVSRASRMFYFTESYDNETDEAAKIRRAAASMLKNQSTHSIEKYNEYILKAVSVITETLKEYFNSIGEDRDYLVYHIGPLTIYKIISTGIKKTSECYVYYYISEGKIARFVPLEMIKSVVNRWFQENINNLGLDFDDSTKFESVKTRVQSLYKEDVKKLQKIAADVTSKGSGKKVNAESVYAIKGESLIGLPAIEVYRRFIGNSIFKNI